MNHDTEQTNYIGKIEYSYNFDKVTRTLPFASMYKASNFDEYSRRANKIRLREAIVSATVCSPWRRVRTSETPVWWCLEISP